MRHKIRNSIGFISFSVGLLIIAIISIPLVIALTFLLIADKFWDYRNYI